MMTQVYEEHSEVWVTCDESPREAPPVPAASEDPVNHAEPPLGFGAAADHACTVKRHARIPLPQAPASNRSRRPRS